MEVQQHQDQEIHGNLRGQLDKGDHDDQGQGEDQILGVTFQSARQSALNQQKSSEGLKGLQEAQKYAIE